jgi:hypothetical protein
MNPVDNILGEKTWVAEFDGGYIVEVTTNETNRNHIMMMARDKLSQENRYNFDARRASGGHILKLYLKRR